MKKQRYSMGRITLLVMIFVMVIIGVGVYMLVQLEKGILSVCATSQDGYVQLVIDQIAIKSNRTNEEIITEILNTLDSSSNKYWVFSESQEMLFVKDVLETNKYKGITVDSYYNSESAMEFLDSLKLNKVTHLKIEMNDKRYIASGSLFEYNGNTYKLCLLTNVDIFLENNIFLESLIELIILFAGMLIIISVITISFSRKVGQLEKENAEQKQTIIVLNKGLSKLNDRLSSHKMYDSKKNIWNHKMLPKFIEQLAERNVDPFTVAKIVCRDEDERDSLILHAQYLLDTNVLRFEIEQNTFWFIFVEQDRESAMRSLKMILSPKSHIERVFVGNGNVDTTEDILKRMEIETERDGH